MHTQLKMISGKYLHILGEKSRLKMLTKQVYRLGAKKFTDHEWC